MFLEVVANQDGLHVGRLDCLWLFIWLVLCPLLAVGQDSQLRQVYEQAQQAQSAGDLATAIQKYQELVRLAPQMAEAHANLGVLYYQQGQLTNASREFKQASALKPDLAGPFFYEGVISLSTGSPGEAVSLLRKADTLEPGNGMVSSYLGLAYFAQHENLAAFDALVRALDLDSKDPNVLYTLNEASRDLAENSFSSLEKRYPNSPYTALKRAHFHESKREWREAAVFYQQAIQNLPQHPALRRKAEWVALQASGKESAPPSPDELADGSLRYLYSPPDKADFSARLQEAVHIARTSTETTAEESYRRGEAYQSVSLLASLALTDQFPESFRAHQLRGNSLAAQFQSDEAIAEYKLALKEQPDAPDLHFAIGNIYWQSGKLNEARAELLQEQARNPKHAYCLYELGDIAYQQHRPEDAEHFLLASLKQRSSLREAHIDLAKVYEDENQTDKAIASLRAAIALNPADPAPHYSLMLLLKRHNRSSEAAEELFRYRKLKAVSELSAPQ